MTAVAPLWSAFSKRSGRSPGTKSGTVSLIAGDLRVARASVPAVSERDQASEVATRRRYRGYVRRIGCTGEYSGSLFSVSRSRSVPSYCGLAAARGDDRTALIPELFVAAALVQRESFVCAGARHGRARLAALVILFARSRAVGRGHRDRIGMARECRITGGRARTGAIRCRPTADGLAVLPFEKYEKTPMERRVIW